MVNQLPCDAPQRAGLKRSVLPEKDEQCPRSLRVRRSLTMSRPEGSAVKRASPWTSVSSVSPPPPTVAEFDGALVARGLEPEKSLVYSSTWTLKGSPGRAVAGAVMSSGSPSKQPLLAPPHAAAMRISSPSCGVKPQMPVDAGTLLT